MPLQCDAAAAVHGEGGEGGESQRSVIIMMPPRTAAA
jgi:hypothetical protein